MGRLSRAVTKGVKRLLRQLFKPISDVIERYANDLVRTIVDTPHPDVVLGEPTNGVWPALYTYYWDSIIPISLLLWGLMVGLVILLESMSYLFSNYHRSLLKKRAVTGLLGILSWWWIAGLSMQFMSGLTGVLVPDLGDVSLFETLSFGGIGVIGIVLTLSVDLALFLLLALVYFTRLLMLYLFVLLMPLLIVFWVPGIGPFALMSQFMKRMAGFYVPFLFMTVPVALLLRLGEILGQSFSLTMGGLGAWLTALVIPFAALVSPIILFWQAGALFFASDRIARRTSTRRATGRVRTVHRYGRDAAHGGRNFGRGLRGEPAQTAGGQTTFGSGRSRAHAAGSRLNASGSRLRGAYHTHRRGGAPEPGQASGTVGADTATRGTPDGVSSPSRGALPAHEPPAESFENLRSRPRRRTELARTDSESEQRTDEHRGLR